MGPEVVEDWGGQLQDLQNPGDPRPVLARDPSQGAHALAAMPRHETFVEVGPGDYPDPSQVGLIGLPGPLTRPSVSQDLRFMVEMEDDLPMVVALKEGGC